MKHKVFTVRDDKAQMYNLPFYSRTSAEATRNLLETMNNPQTMINKYPTDYSLWQVGEYDDVDGTFQTHPPIHIVNAIDLQDQRPGATPQGSTETLRLSQ